MNVPSGAYDSIDATFAFSITWAPPGAEDVADEILTVIGPDGDEVGSSDGSSTTEKVVGLNLSPGIYHVLACGFVNAAPQAYSGKLEVTTSARATEQSLVGFVPIGIVPVQLSVTVWPAEVGTVTELLGGVEPGATAATVAMVATATTRTASRRAGNRLPTNRTDFIFSPRGR